MVPLTEKRTVDTLLLVIVHEVVAPLAPQPPPLHVYDVGELLQFAVMVAVCPMANVDAGLTVGTHVGTGPEDVRHVTVCVGGVPETLKVVQLGLL